MAMMFPRLRLVNKSQKGFTLIELMLVFALTGIIGSGITMTFHQLVTGSARTNNHMIAVAQVQDAGYWVSHDAQMAQSIISDDPATPGVTEFLTLTWTLWDSNAPQRVAYTFVDIPGSGLKNLQRIHTSGGTTTETGIIAKFIDPDSTKTKCELNGGTFILPDINDAFAITGGAVADSGTITATAGSIEVTTGGGATYSSSTHTWTTPAGGGTVNVSSGGSTAAGTWTSTKAGVSVALTADSDGDAKVTSHLLTLTVTASVGTGAQGQSETRVYRISPRPS